MILVQSELKQPWPELEPQHYGNCPIVEMIKKKAIIPENKQEIIF